MVLTLRELQKLCVLLHRIAHLTPFPRASPHRILARSRQATLFLLEAKQEVNVRFLVQGNKIFGCLLLPDTAAMVIISGATW